MKEMKFKIACKADELANEIEKKMPEAEIAIDFRNGEITRRTYDRE
jgi:hypothetical protein